MSIRSTTLAALVAASTFAVMFPTAAAAAGHCDDVMAASRSMQSDLTQALAAMNAKDTARMRQLLPSLERAFNVLPAVEITPENCTTHVSTYTALQYTQLTTLKARGLSTGFPASLPIVKQPDLNHLSLAYAVGWIKFELGDFAGAKTAYAKGLKMYPHDPNLQSEYMATLLQQQDAAGVVAFGQQALDGTPNYSDGERAKIYRGMGVAYALQNDKANAKEMLTIAQRYEWEKTTEDLLKQIDGQGQ
jgi:tetratricopeptide (TPR) repeat protein